MLDITFDLETIPTNDPRVIDDLRATIKPPASYTKPESIAKWMEENLESEHQSAIRKTALNGAHGRICCIGYKFGDDEAESITHEPGPDGERALLDEFFTDLKHALKFRNMYHDQLRFIGHNIIGFDLRFLFQRSVILGVQPPSFIPFSAKPWDKQVYDTMTRWAGDRNTISLDNLDKALGGEGKGDVSGKDVYDLWLAGERDKIAEYCISDVEKTYRAYKRMTFAGT